MLAIALYAITLGGGYVYDDQFVVRDDPRVHDPHQWSRLWTRDYFDGGIDNLYRPLVSSSYALQWWLHGDRPWIFHLVNVLVHALAAGGVAEFTRRAIANLNNTEQAESNANTIALIAGLLFAAHPIHVEAVANIVGRAELACAACIFAALIILLKRPMTIPRVSLSISIALIGLLCKEQGILQPLLWVLLAVLMWKKKNAPSTPNAAQPPDRSAITMLILLTAWSWAIYLLVREHFLKFEWDRIDMDPTVQPLIQSGGADRILMPIVLLGHYTALLLWPAHLSLDYGADVIGHIARAGDPYLWLGLLAIAIWVLLIIFCLISRTPKNRFILFCLLGLALTYGIVGNIITLIGTIFAERLMYLPSAFFLMIVAVELGNFPHRIKTFATAIILTLACARTVIAARNWNHPVDLYRASVNAQPMSIQAHLLLAEEYHRLGNRPQAQAVLDDICRRYPNYWRVWQYQCEEAMEDGNFALADAYLARAIHLDHNPALINVSGRLSKAEAATRPTRAAEQGKSVGR